MINIIKKENAQSSSEYMFVIALCSIIAVVLLSKCSDFVLKVFKMLLNIFQ